MSAFPTQTLLITDGPGLHVGQDLAPARNRTWTEKGESDEHLPY